MHVLDRNDKRFQEHALGSSSVIICNVRPCHLFHSSVCLQARLGAQPERPQTESHASFSEVQSSQAWQRADTWPASPDNSISSLPSMPNRSNLIEMADGYHRKEEVTDWQSQRNGRNGAHLQTAEAERRDSERPHPTSFHEPERAVHETDDPWLDERDFSQQRGWNPVEVPVPAAEPQKQMPSLKPSKPAYYDQDRDLLSCGLCYILVESRFVDCSRRGFLIRLQSLPSPGKTPSKHIKTTLNSNTYKSKSLKA